MEPERILFLAIAPMMMWRLWVIISGVVAFLVAVWNFGISPTYTLRFRNTIVVAVEDRVINGSGVCEIRYETAWFADKKWWISESCEAIPIDLGSKGYLFSVADWRNVDCITGRDFPNDASLASQWFPELTFGADAVEIPRKDLPFVVRFADLADPNSLHDGEPVEFDRPANLGNGNLAKDFGLGVKLIGGTVQIVSRGFWPFNRLGASEPQWLFGVPLTRGIEKILPWLARRPERIPAEGARWPLSYLNFKLENL